MMEELTVFRAIAGFAEAGTPCALCTVEGVAGSTPRDVGARMAVPIEGQSVGTVGGGALESAIIEKAREWIAAGTSGTVELMLDDAVQGGLASKCGGAVRVRIETIAPPRRVVIFGAGHVGAATARVARAAGFLPVVADDRDDVLEPLRREGIAVVAGPLDRAVDAVGVRPTDAVVVVTRGHNYDVEVVGAAIRRPSAYLGMIGSRRKVADTKKALRAAGIQDDTVDALHAPIGLDIGAETPGEIAVAIVAEIISLLRRKGEA